MNASLLADSPLVIVVGSGGVGKTTLAAALGLRSAAAGHRTLVMTFDPSRRLKDALGIGDTEGNEEVAVAGTGGQLYASVLDARATFDSLVERYAASEAERDRILANPYYEHLAGHLGGILEYMAVERLYEVATSERYERVFLDTPPTAQAIDFLEAPQRIVDFLDSGALKIALAPWFAADGSLRPTS
ncbi:MAG: ArsA-related P-loop ATPase, partial [Acidobacteriota bacterium]